MNLHKIVRGAVTRINPDEENTLTQATGVINNKGLLTAETEAAQVKAQWQPIAQPLEHSNGWGATQIEMKVYLYSDEALPVAGVRRLPAMRTGDTLTRADGTAWFVTNVLEDWNAVGWACVTATQQEGNNG